MIDFHSHILPGIDDGSRNLEQSIYMVNEAKNVGFTKIISTSHYMENYYECNEQERKRLLKEVQDSVDGIELYLGNEIYITNNMIDLLKNGQASSINNTRYVLFEFPLINTKPMNDKEVIYRLIENGYIPIIAHPERYPFVQENPDYLFELEEMGALFQANFGSIIGMYGGKAKKTLKILLKNKTMIKDPKKLAQRMSILCILIGFIALAVGIIAMAMEQYIIAIAMGIVTVGQVWNYNKWKRVR